MDEMLKTKNFNVGDRVKALIGGVWISAEVVSSVDNRGSIWCTWDDDGEDATMHIDCLEYDELYDSPLRKAMR